MKKFIACFILLTFPFLLIGCNSSKVNTLTIKPIPNKKIIKTVHKTKIRKSHKKIKVKKQDLADEIFKEVEDVLPE